MGLTREESPASTMGMIHLGKNLLLPYWGFTLDAWHIEEESSTFLLRMMFSRFDPFEEESSASFTGDLPWCTWVHWGGIFCLFHRYNAWYAWTIKEESSTSFIVMILDTFGKNLLLPSLGILLEMLEMLKKSLLLPYWGWCLIGLITWGTILYFLHWGYFS